MPSEREPAPGAPAARPQSSTDKELYVVPRRFRVCTGDELGPGEAGAWRIPGPLVVALSPVLGGLYAVAFPLVVFFTVVQIAWIRLRPVPTGAPASWGLYVGRRAPRLVEVRVDGAPLEGAPGARYVRVPRLLLLLLSPVLGGLLVLALPPMIGAAIIGVPLRGLWRALFGGDDGAAPQGGLS